VSSRAEPFYCPYCGEEDLRPHGTTHGEWECRACRRVFALSMRGLLPTSRPADPAEAGSAGSAGLAEGESG
jgi:transposase-like protein